VTISRRWSAPSPSTGCTRRVDRVFGFDAVPEAFAHFEAQRHFGKVCIRL
jgi:NADPH:quinone reductase-like Zn-dependent oxidoreductase